MASKISRHTFSMELGTVKVIQSPIGLVAVGASDQGLAEVVILEPGQRRAEFSNSSISEKHAVAATRQLNEFFSGVRDRFDLDLDIKGTEFQKAVWGAIADLNKGEILSYAELAKAIGRPLAARAVGGAVGSNPVPLVIGCHRILGSSGTLTGYSGGGGLKTKRWLLNFEGISFKQ